MSKLQTVGREGKRPYPPRRSAFTGTFWDNLAQGRFTTTRCADCSKMTFPPKPFCPHCWSQKVDWADLKPSGKVYSYTVIHAVPSTFAADAPYTVAIVDLDDGIRIATRLLDRGGQHVIDQPVEIVHVVYDDGPLFAARLKQA
jgi:uncharacterized OB-fold protein